MSVDYTAHMMYGTTDKNVWDMLPYYIQETLEYIRSEEIESYSEEDVSDMYVEIENSIDRDLDLQEKDNIRKLMDKPVITVIMNGYDSSFDGMGAEGKPSTVDTKLVDRFFAKFELGEPDWVCFVNQW